MKDKPTNVKIGWQRYNIVYVNDVRNWQDEKMCGDIDNNKNRIRISTEICDTQMKLTLFHEIFHGISNRIGAELREGQVEGLSNALFESFRDDPRVWKWIMEK
jgi:hypothetical protein